MSKDFAAWYEALPDEEKTSFASRADTTRNYVESHLLAPYKIPRAESMSRLAAASGQFTVAELAAWFYDATLARQARNPQRTGAAQ